MLLAASTMPREYPRPMMALWPSSVRVFKRGSHMPGARYVAAGTRKEGQKPTMGLTMGVLEVRNPLLHALPSQGLFAPI